MIRPHETGPPPPSCAIAFKEWAGVCRALGAGRQILIIRKGGIAEGPGGFAPEHDTFWLYPTHVHEAQQGLREDVPAPPAGDPSTVAIDCLAQVVRVGRIERPELLESIEPFHVWTAETVRKRYAYRQPGLWLLAVRAHRLATPWQLAVTADQAGCKSWVPLARGIATRGLRPVLDDRAFAARLEQLSRALATGEGVRA
jgi:hypothetical protein